MLPIFLFGQIKAQKKSQHDFPSPSFPFFFDLWVKLQAATLGEGQLQLGFPEIYK